MYKLLNNKAVDNLFPWRGRGSFVNEMANNCPRGHYVEANPRTPIANGLTRFVLVENHPVLAWMRRDWWSPRGPGGRKMQTKNINISREQTNEDNCDLQKSCRQDHQGLPTDMSVTQRAQGILNQVTRAAIGSTYRGQYAI
ncbi:hypothetical protein RR48_08769 [Papilio machaon]|uniref:Uncharacterized protein n=1 Tax=Papilio machaon TaxID=76193 RepID=A0A194RHH5_PAPMA|nr:hypothetical protein RR48_08769 [Papilio machaon]